MNHFLIQNKKKSTEILSALNKKLKLNYLDTNFGGLACDTVKLSVSADRIRNHTFQWQRNAFRSLQPYQTGF